MNDENLLQILDQSACLSKSQLMGYINHTLYPEELRAVELHLSSCPLCSDALDGLEQLQQADALLKSMTPPALPAPPPREKPKEIREPAAAKPEKTAARETAVNQAAKEARPASRPLREAPVSHWKRNAGIAAAIAAGIGILWYVEFRPRPDDVPGLVTENRSEDLPENAPQEHEAGSGPVAAAQLPAAETPEKPLHTADTAAPHKKNDEIAKSRIAEDSNSSRQLLAEAAPPEAQQEKTAAVADRTATEERRQETEDTGSRKRPAASETARMASTPAAKTTAKENTPKEASGKEEPSDYATGLRLYKQKNYASALMYFKSAESDKSDPRHWDAVYYSALCNKYLDKKRRAIKLFERIVKADAPRSSEAAKQIEDLKAQK